MTDNGLGHLYELRYTMIRSPMLHILVTLALFFTGWTSLKAQPTDKLPNILFILADDLGYGDLACYNAQSKIPTPNLDKLAADGMRFTDAHSPSTVCTPTRYSILTGRMQFRTGMRGVFTGVGGPCLIAKDRLTLPQMLRNKGYKTACIGKWHIGMSFFDKDGQLIKDRGIQGVQKIDYSRPIPDAPIHRGFDQFYGTVSCPTTDWLYAYVDGDRIPVPPTKLLDKSKIPDHPYSHDCRRGMVAENFKHEEVDLVFLKKSQQFLEQHVKNTPNQPFFLYHSMQAVHLPSLAADQFKGATKSGPHGDFIFEMDYIVGELRKTLERLGVANNTLIMFASDNGPEVPTVLDMRKTYQHDGARPWRGVKRDQWEGGHRTPFIVNWPGKVKRGSTSDQLISLTDVMATCAAIADAQLPNTAAEDSYNFLPVLISAERQPMVRSYMLQQTISLAMSIRSGKWKYLDHRGSGGNNYGGVGPWSMKPYALKDNDPTAPGQLYNLEADPGETINLFNQHPEIVKKLKTQLELYKTSGRSAPLR
jgi:arylsulfatase A